jgi:hypothetical protein
MISDTSRSGFFIIGLTIVVLFVALILFTAGALLHNGG